MRASSGSVDVAGEDALGEDADVGEAGVLADRAGAGAAHLDAVVRGGVVAGGEHGAGEVEGAARVVEAVGAREADQRDVDAAAAGAVGEGRGQLGARVAHVVTDDAGGGPWRRCRRRALACWRRRRRVGAEDDDLGEGRSEGAGDPGVELVRDDAAHVVGLDDVGEGDRSHGWRAYGSSGVRPGRHGRGGDARRRSSRGPAGRCPSSRRGRSRRRGRGPRVSGIGSLAAACSSGVRQPWPTPASVDRWSSTAEDVRLRSCPQVRAVAVRQEPVLHSVEVMTAVVAQTSTHRSDPGGRGRRARARSDRRAGRRGGRRRCPGTTWPRSTGR